MSANPRPLRLPPMPKVADLLRVYGLSAKKQLSQNFILDLNITGNATVLMCVKGQSRGGWKEQEGGGGERGLII